MEPRTHLHANPSLCGKVLQIGDGTARVALETTDAMAVDSRGLIHGGFVFGLADYAAMLAVNDPHVVLGSAESRFVKPVRRGDRIIASARTVLAEGRKHEVRVEATVGSNAVFEGTFTCFVLERHVLETPGST
jgi:acyl-coenzyme A thioesterase PaaI-like protein